MEFDYVSQITCNQLQPFTEHTRSSAQFSLPVELMTGTLGVSEVKESTSISSSGNQGGWPTSRSSFLWVARQDGMSVSRIKLSMSVTEPELSPVHSSLLVVTSLICQRSLHHFCPKTLSRIGTQSWATAMTVCLSGSVGEKKKHYGDGNENNDLFFRFN